MKDFDDISSTITKYIKGLLTGKELEAFTQQLERDSELREEVEFRKLMIDGIKILGDQRLKKNIERVKRNIKDEESDPDEVHVGRLKIKTLNWNIIPSKKRIVWIAASVLLAILSGFLYANLNYTNQKLAAKNYSFSSVSRGNIENNDIDDLFEKAAEAIYHSSWSKL